MTSTDRKTIALVALAGIAILAALWMLVISPKRDERAQVRENVAAQQERLQAAQTQLASYETARKQFPAKLAELKTLDKAVPARGAISSLLRQLQRRANVRNSDLRLVALKAGAAAPVTTTGGAAPAPPTTPGATVGPDGLAALPFTFEFTGEYFDLRDILQTVRRSVSVRKDTIKVDGRLLTIDGLSFTRVDPTSDQTKAIAQRHRLHRPRRGLHPTAAGCRRAPLPDRGRVMMLRNLLDEMMRRRLLPVAALARARRGRRTAAVPEGAPDGAPSADSAAPAAAETAKLPARAARLLATNDADASRGGANGSRAGPVQPAGRPSARRAAKAAAVAAAAAKATPARRARARARSRRRTTKPTPRRRPPRTTSTTLEPKSTPPPSPSPDSSASTKRARRPRSTSATAPRSDYEHPPRDPAQQGVLHPRQARRDLREVLAEPQEGGLRGRPGLHISGRRQVPRRRTASAATSTSRPARMPG